MEYPGSVLEARLAEAAARRQVAQLQRSRCALQAIDAVRVHDGERELLNFSANDYLGLAGHEDLVRAIQDTAASEGAGAGASALVTGYRRSHRAFEEELAEFLQRDQVLLCASGYLANLAVATSLAGRGDLIVQDRLCHASLIDAARLSGARLARYRHLDVDSLQRQLGQTGGDGILVVTEGVFSMDGDRAPLPDIQRSAESAGASLVVDDAHGVGVLGPEGRGSVAAAGLDQRQVPVLVGTLGKAFGSAGAFVAGSKELIAHLVNEARSYIFTTAPPPVLAAAGMAALRRIRADHWRRARLSELIEMFSTETRARGLPVPESDTPIQPMLAGESATALQWSQSLRAQGFLVTAIRPPTVPAGTARLRISLSAAHEPAQVTALLDGLESCLENS